jgi:hypothetical protein
MPQESPYQLESLSYSAKLGLYVLVSAHDITTSNLPVAGVTKLTATGTNGLKLPTAGRPNSSYDNYIYTHLTPAATAGYFRLNFVDVFPTTPLVTQQTHPTWGKTAVYSYVALTGSDIPDISAEFPAGSGRFVLDSSEQHLSGDVSMVNVTTTLEPCRVVLRPLVEGSLEIGMVAYVHQELIDNTTMPTLGMEYKDWNVPTRDRSFEELGDYEFTGLEAGPDGYLGFAFAKTKTEAERNTPFRTYTKVENHTWHTVLLAIAVIPEDGFPQSTYAVVNNQKTLVSAPRYYGREIYIPQMSLATLHTVEEFISPTKFVIAPRPQPMPLPVDYEVLNVERSFPSCLHDDLTLPATRTGTAQLVAGSAGAGRSGALDGYDFPATNFKTWQAHYVHDDQNFVNGVWHRVRIRVTPPPMPKPVSN